MKLTFEFEVKDSVKADVAEAFGYKETITQTVTTEGKSETKEIPNPVSLEAHVKEWMVTKFSNIVEAVQIRNVQREAREKNKIGRNTIIK